MSPGRLVVVWVVAIAATLAGPGCSRSDSRGAGAHREVRVAAAADLRFALEDIAAEFQKRHPDIRIKSTFGSSGSFFAQLMNQAPFDMFLSADVDYPRRLVAQGLARKETEFLYAVGRLVVWVPASSGLDLETRGMEALADPSVRKVSIANPRHAPYGRAAEAAMKNLGVYEKVKDRLVLGENVVQAAQFVESGSADAGILALSLAAAPAMKDKGRYWEIPFSAYPRMDQGGVILPGAQDPQAAREFRDFLTSAEGKAVLKRYGFFLPGE